MEIRGLLVGAVLCVLGLILFVYGTGNITRVNVVSSSFLVVIGVFLGIAGLLVLIMNMFSTKSAFS